MPEPGGGIGADGAASAPGCTTLEAQHQHQLGQQDEADERAERRILDEAGAQLGEVDVEHHDDEQEQHRHRADVDHHQDHGQELGAQQHEQARRIEEGEDQEQHRVHGVPGRDHHEARGHRDGGEQIEEAGARSWRPTIARSPPAAGGSSLAL